MLLRLFGFQFWDLPAGLYTFPDEFKQYVACQDAGAVLVLRRAQLCAHRMCVGRIVLLDAADPTTINENIFEDLRRKYHGRGSMILCGVVENKQQQRKLNKTQGRRYAHSIDHYCDYLDVSLDRADSVRRAVFHLIALLHTDGLKAAYGPI